VTTPLEPGTLDNPATELVKRVPRAVSPVEAQRAYLVMLVALPTLCFLVAFMWVLFHP
jgi:hypothetical protein